VGVTPTNGAYNGAWAALRAVHHREAGYPPYDDVSGAKRAGLRAVLMQGSDVPPCAAANPDAIIGRLAGLRALLDPWSPA
jgi:hypothetical protein